MSDRTSNGTPSDPGLVPDEDAMHINAVKLILAEKRTSLASVRTGIAIIALPLTVVGLLIATSKYYDVLHVVALLVPLLVVCGALVMLGFYMITKAVVRIHHHDRMVRRIKRKHSGIASLMD